MRWLYWLINGSLHDEDVERKKRDVDEAGRSVRDAAEEHRCAAGHVTEEREREAEARSAVVDLMEEVVRGVRDHGKPHH